MITIGFRDLKESADEIRNRQAVSHVYFLSASIPVPNGRTAKAVLAADKDADICITGISASVIAPSTLGGQRLADQRCFWPMPATVTGYAERGLTLNIFAGSNKNLQLSEPSVFKAAVPPYTEDGFTYDAKNLLQPGYYPGNFSRPIPFNYYLKRSDQLTFQFYNRDRQRGDHGEGDFFQLYHYVTLTLTCKKYEPFAKV